MGAWEGLALPANAHALEYVPTADHNAFNATPRAVVNRLACFAGLLGAHVPSAGPAAAGDRRTGATVASLG